MRHTTACLLAATLLLASAAVGCSKPYEDTVADCAAALKDRPKDDGGKPDACEDVKEDDYSALLMSQTIDDLGWIDENGEVDKNKMLEDATQP
ncbi:MULTISPECIES: hypothetical protein [Streptomyces]|uniref:hypothetical protein n=1 Tax=Streptomyces TaxID=1883 RepID=UPI0029BCEBA6|nr:hypothetical protein [Streptomyces stelliscabiei]MDX2520575.1 hypothetical protein [Streptomyces stelliscabiei]MDX2552672.1 hypothetical protein [Streptomyces stelliscabiei]MDX2661356.1 hypothetical protein [Streptomyces stelliscabiei]MDX2788837.1 hypothetical protein [Streptomyces stelliscabiei]